MLTNIVSPPTGGSVRMWRIDPRGGVPRKVTSVCHHEARSSRPSMGRTWGWPSRDSMTGWAGVTSPNCPANAAWASGERSWSMKKSTRWRPNAARTWATVSSPRGSARSRPAISAPMFDVSGLISSVPPGGMPPWCPAEVAGTTAIQLAGRRRRNLWRLSGPVGTRASGAVRGKTMATGGPGAAVGRQWRRLRRRSMGAQVGTLVVVVAIVAGVAYAVASGGSSPGRSGSGPAASTGTSIPTGTPSGIGVDQASTSTRGITKTTINIAFPISNLTSLASNFGFARDAEYSAQRKAITTYVNAVNANGGIDGRRINPIIANIDPTNEASMRALCKQWTEGSPPVFAVLDGVGSWTGDNELCVAQEGKTPLIGQWTTVTNWTQEGAPYLWWTGPDQAQILATVVQWGKSSGLLTNSSRIGIVAGDRTSDQVALNQYLLPDLRRAGFTDPLVETLPSNPADTAATNSAAPLVVQRLKSAGVKSVIPLIPFNSFFPFLDRKS